MLKLKRLGEHHRWLRLDYGMWVTQAAAIQQSGVGTILVRRAMCHTLPDRAAALARRPCWLSRKWAAEGTGPYPDTRCSSGTSLARSPAGGWTSGWACDLLRSSAAVGLGSERSFPCSRRTSCSTSSGRDWPTSHSSCTTGGRVAGERCCVGSYGLLWWLCGPDSVRGYCRTAVAVWMWGNSGSRGFRSCNHPRSLWTTGCPKDCRCQMGGTAMGWTAC